MFTSNTPQPDDRKEDEQIQQVIRAMEAYIALLPIGPLEFYAQAYHRFLIGLGIQPQPEDYDLAEEEVATVHFTLLALWKQCPYNTKGS